SRTVELQEREGALGACAYLVGHEDLVRHGELRNSRREVHDGPVVVAAACEDFAERQTTAWRDPALFAESLDELERDLRRRGRVDGHEHHLVADELDDLAAM